MGVSSPTFPMAANLLNQVPRMGDGKVLHVGVGPGEVAQRIVTCGTPTRAAALAAHLDGVNGAAAKDCSHIFYFESSRGFTTYTVGMLFLFAS